MSSKYNPKEIELKWAAFAQDFGGPSKKNGKV